MLRVETQYLDDCQVRLTVSIDDARVQDELHEAAKRISGKVNVPGFRRGKAPYQIVLRHVGEEAVYDEALEPLTQAVYAEALDEAKIEPFAPGSLDNIARAPMVLTFTVPLPPQVELGSYRDIRVPFKVEKVTEKDVDHAIEHLLDEQATLEHVDRPVNWSDVAVLNIKGTVHSRTPVGKKAASGDESAQDSSFIDRQGVRVLIAKEATFPVPGFPEHVVGMPAGESRSFDIKLPTNDDDVVEDLRGKTIHFDIDCNEVLKRDLPVLDDEFARSLGEYQDLADLRRQLRSQLELDAERSSRTAHVSKIFDALLTQGTVKVAFPPILVEQQKDDMVADFDRQLRRQGMNLEDYLSLNSITLDQLRSDFAESAQGQVQRGLILGKLCEVEGITVEEDEIEDEIQTQLLSFGTQATLARQLFSSPEVKKSIANRRLTDKGLDRLVEIAKGVAPPLTQASDKATMPEPADSPRRSGGAAKRKPSKAKKTASSD